MKNWSAFRAWVHQLWVDNCEEHDLFKMLKYSEKEYFQKYKWWLKREFKHQSRTNPK